MDISKLHSVFYLGNKWMFLANAKRGFAYYKEYRLDLITGLKEEFNFTQWIEELKHINFNYNSKRVMHLCYELGEYFEFGKVSSDDLLAIDIEYSEEYIVNSFKLPKSKFELSPLFKIDFKKYKKAFHNIQKHLQKGDCYQVNLTYPFTYSFDSKTKIENFYNRFWASKEKLSPYAHSTYIPNLNRLILSNSPECLFQTRMEKDKLKLWTMPIKGSERLVENVQKSWQKLVASKKERGELYMITDLLRNDLSRIGRPFSKVVIKRAPLVVPGIVHQFSLIDIDLDVRTSLYEVLKALFPGGSITGAPKKRVMEIIKHTEMGPRVFYTGSTILFNKKIKAASINIRTMDISFLESKATYGAGGGITLLSDDKNEYDEMNLKVESFFNFFQ